VGLAADNGFAALAVVEEREELRDPCDTFYFRGDLEKLTWSTV